MGVNEEFERVCDWLTVELDALDGASEDLSLETIVEEVANALGRWPALAEGVIISVREYEQRERERLRGVLG